MIPNQQTQTPDTQGNKGQPVKKKLVTALLSLAVAFALWLYVITVISPESQETFHDIPVSFQGISSLENKDLMLITEGTPTVTLELSGNRVDLNKLSTSNISVTVDLSKIYDPGKNAVLYDISYPGDVAYDAITVQSRTPTGITLNVVRRSYKEVPVQVDYTGALPEGFIKEKAELELETIRISGPEDVVEKIKTARVQIPLTEDSKTSITGEYTYTLCDAQQNPVDAKYISVTGENAGAITVTVPIKRVKEIPLTVKVVEGGGATEQNSSIVIDPVSIQVSGDEEILEDLEQLEIGTVDLSSMLEDAELTFEIVLPEGVTNETGLTSATVKISFPELLMKTFHVTQFKAENVPQGLQAVISAKELSVTLRGNKADIEKLSASDITVTVDFTGAEEGTQRWDAQITVAGDGDVGAVGTYTVLAVVAPKDKAVSATE